MNKNVKIEHMESVQVVDWTAVLWAGFIAGAIFLFVAGWILPLYIGGNIWIILRLISSMVLGSAVLAPPATYDFSVLLVGLLVHFTLSLLFTSLLAFITHRWGLMTGTILGALFGWGLYLINVYSLTLFFPSFIMMKHPAFLITHIIFGVTAGGVYELLEVEEFECVKPA